MSRGVGFGIFFVAAGVLFFLDALEVVRVRGAYVWPLLLIGLGLAVLFGGLGRRAKREAAPPREAELRREAEAEALPPDAPGGPRTSPEPPAESPEES